MPPCPMNVTILGKYKTPVIPEYATNNAHMFYILCKDFEERNQFIASLKAFLSARFAAITSDEPNAVLISGPTDATISAA